MNIIFDMDGLMFDTEKVVIKAWDYAGEKIGVGKAGFMVYKTLGMNRAASNNVWKEEFGDRYSEEGLRKYTKEFLKKYYDENKNLVNFVTINVNEPDLKIVQNVKTAEFTIPMYFDTDSTVNTKYNVDTLPHIFFIEEDGTISKEFTSNITEDAFTANLDLLEKNY